MLPIFNERQYATSMNDGASKNRDVKDKRKYTFRELLIYTKWLRWNMWYDREPSKDGINSEIAIRNGLISFCEDIVLNFNMDTDYNYIDNLMKESTYFKLREYNPSQITNNEWGQIMGLTDENARKTYFACLILAKFNRNNPVQKIGAKPKTYEDKRYKVKADLPDIQRYAGVTFRRVDLKENKKLYYQPVLVLQKAGLITPIFYKKKTTFILNEADIDINVEDIFLKIADYEDIESQYKYAMKEKGQLICNGCNKAFKSRTPKYNEQYCEACSKRSQNKIVFKICSSCGKRFESNNLAINTELCSECYKEKRKKDIKKHVKKQRNRPM